MFSIGSLLLRLNVSLTEIVSYKEYRKLCYCYHVPTRSVQEQRKVWFNRYTYCLKQRRELNIRVK